MIYWFLLAEKNIIPVHVYQTDEYYWIGNISMYSTVMEPNQNIYSTVTICSDTEDSNNSL